MQYKYVALFLMIILSLVSFASAQDSVHVSVKMPTDVWDINTDPSIKAEIWIKTNVGINVSSACFIPSRNIVRIDSVTWSDTMQALVYANLCWPSVHVNNDTIINNLVYTYTSPGFFLNFYGHSPTGPVIAPGDDEMHFANIYLTIKPDSLPAIINNPIVFYVDSSFIPPTSDFVFTSVNGMDINPIFFVTDTLAIKYELNFICGDANNDSQTNFTDAIYLINYIFRSGQGPDPEDAGDVNCDQIINIADILWILNYIFLSGNAPCDLDGNGLPDC